MSLDTFFRQFSSVLNTFATRHNLLLEKYPRDWPAWSFTFRHPKGGLGSIGALREADNSLKLYASWWIDDLDKYARLSYAEDSGTTKIDPGNLNDLLEDHLRKIVSWPVASLERVDYNYEPLWKPYKQQLAKSEGRFPIPKL